MLYTMWYGHSHKNEKILKLLKFEVSVSHNDHLFSKKQPRLW